MILKISRKMFIILSMMTALFLAVGVMPVSAQNSLGGAEKLLVVS